MDNTGTRDSCIGKGTKISGNMTFKGVRIEGQAEGEITGEDLVIADGAIVNARIVAARVSIGGTVTGEIAARERVELLPTARVRGSIHTPRISLEEGAKFDGDCNAGPRESVHGETKSIAPSPTAVSSDQK